MALVPQVRQQAYFSGVDASGRLVTSLLALGTFTDVTTVPVKILVATNLISSVFVPVPVVNELELVNDATESLKEGV